MLPTWLVMSDYLTKKLEQNSPLADLCIVNLIKKHAQKNPDSIAIVAQRRPPLTNKSLYNLVLNKPDFWRRTSTSIYRYNVCDPKALSFLILCREHPQPR